MVRILGLLVVAACALAVAGSGADAASGAPPEPGASVASGSVTAGSVTAARWSWPVRGAHVIVRPFIAPTTQYSAGHRGIDIAASGDVYAPEAGVVHFSGFVVDRNVLSITHSGDVISSYEPVLSPLRKGEVVSRGEDIGTIEPGHCTELCLHFGVRVDGEYVSPLLFLGGVQRPVLLPTHGDGS